MGARRQMEERGAHSLLGGEEGRAVGVGKEAAKVGRIGKGVDVFYKVTAFFVPRKKEGHVRAKRANSKMKTRPEGAEAKGEKGKKLFDRALVQGGTRYVADALGKGKIGRMQRNDSGAMLGKTAQ